MPDRCYYFDPRLTQQGIITRQMVKAEAATLTPKDLETLDSDLLAERTKLKKLPIRRYPKRGSPDMENL